MNGRWINCTLSAMAMVGVALLSAPAQANEAIQVLMNQAKIVKLAQDQLQGGDFLLIGLGHDDRHVAGHQHRHGLIGEFERAWTIDEGQAFAHEIGGGDNRLDAHRVGARFR